MRFPVNLLSGWRSVLALNGQRRSRIIGVMALLAVAGLLQACSTLKLFYNQTPGLAYWYLDGHFDFLDAQSLRVKDDLAGLQAWHRKTQLPGYIATLQKLQQQLPQDITADAACAVFADVRGKLAAVSGQAEPAVAAVVATLNASQLVQLERRFAKGNAEYRGDFMEGSPQDRQDKRVKQLRTRAERLYGRLDEPQRAVLSQRTAQSRFNASVFYAEKLRRQQDVLRTLRPVIAGQAAPEQTQAAVRGLFERTINPTEPALRQNQNALNDENCSTFAALHNSTTAAQRVHAVQTLQRYEQDFRTLNAE
jgi:hypothetical protein